MASAETEVHLRLLLEFKNTGPSTSSISLRYRSTHFSYPSSKKHQGNVRQQNRGPTERRKRFIANFYENVSAICPKQNHSRGATHFMPKLVGSIILRTNLDNDMAKVAPSEVYDGVEVLSWSHLSYSVNNGSKVILNDSSGRVSTGSVVAILGPSGSGKTTLLDVLAARVDKAKPGRSVTGEIISRTDTKARYVQQEDALVGVLTVRETFVFAARLAGTNTEAVDKYLEELGLLVCQDTQIGTIFFKGISGGQKRRVR